MNFKQLVQKNRSYRRFYQEEKIAKEQILEWIETSRYTPSGRNLQAIKYIVSVNEASNSEIFSTLSWAGYLSGWNGPEPGEQPSAYIVMLTDLSLSQHAPVDIGIQAQTILLAATNEGFGGCMIASVKKAALKTILNIPENFDISLVLAMGKPKEIVVTENLHENGDIRYWRDEKQVHHVPKRLLQQLVLRIID